jgi:hypothetical protein
MSQAKRYVGVGWAVLLVLVVVVHLVTTDAALRVAVLRAILVLAALGEALSFASFEFRPRRAAENSGRPYDPAYHGVMQDFGFYNLAIAMLLGLAAVDPQASPITLAVVVAIYLAHGTTHVFRYFGLYFGGGRPIPTRPQAFELRDGLQLAAPALGMILFFP